MFAEVLAATMAEPIILAPRNVATGVEDPARMAEAFVDALLDVTDPGRSPLDGFTIMLRSASSPRAAEIARAQIEAHHQRTMTDALHGDLASQRAGVLLALVAGIQVMRQLIGLTDLAQADPAVLRGILLPVFR